MNHKPDSFPCHLEHSSSSGLSGDTLLNGEKQCGINGDGAGNNHANNTFESNNHNNNHDYSYKVSGNTYHFNFSTQPLPTIHEISRTLSESLKISQVGYQAKRGRGGMPALHYAADIGDETEVERILKSWSVESIASKRMRNLCEKDKPHGMTPLHYAAKRGNETITRLILSYHAERARSEFNSRRRQKGKQPPKNVPGATPPIKPEDAVKSFLASKSKEHGMDALHFAAAGGHDNVAKALLGEGADIMAKCSWDGMNSMHYAALFGHVNILSLLKSYLDSQEDTTDKPDSRKRKEDKNKDPHKPPIGKNPPLPPHEEDAANSMPDAQQMDWTIVQSKKARKRRHLKPNREDNPEQKAVLKDMLETKSKKSGMTPLHFAASSGRNAAVRFLIECGASVEAKCNWNKRAPIHYAANYGHSTTAKLLYDHNADINVVCGREGMAPLHHAARMGHEVVVKFLCENGADFSFGCRWWNMTPLHYAAKHGHEVVVRMLVLYHHPSTPFRDGHERTASQYAEYNGNESMRHFLNHYYKG
ncbi:unnamed protein product [Tuber aestivum]|uniref:Uncharacterized protein n=1 Tax=Tuber aestivum TaxID=59557 RepID=A0A292Q5Q9_9PEZI|nr:unnamed protein product [Tuber aestivum]